MLQRVEENQLRPPPLEVMPPEPRRWSHAIDMTTSRGGYFVKDEKWVLRFNGVTPLNLSATYLVQTVLLQSSFSKHGTYIPQWREFEPKRGSEMNAQLGDF
ncbi:hypothetical protein V7S43_006384 [Phytophthora oleae]|uniref:Uncharacterized protein n=1 Tax=Phytophthora oleae TaxID=2107226 RepID=A0ABD3FRH5_9STRA